MEPPKDDLFSVLDQSLITIEENDIIIITSKIVSIHQGRCIKRDIANKEELVIEESQYFLSDKKKAGRNITVINHALAINAGIDPFHGYYVLLPQKPNQIAKEIHHYLKTKHKISRLGVIITDSHSTPLRRGVLCYAVGYHGISPLITWHDSKTLKGWTSNVVDAVAAMAGIYLGESAQKHHLTPVVIARGIEFLEFSEKTYEKEFFVEGEDDMYNALYSHFNRKKTKENQS